MQTVNKIAIILFTGLLIMNSGCSVFRKAVRPDDKADISDGFIMYGNIAENNISTGGLFVRRGRVESYVGGDRNRFTVNLRVSGDGVWLASVRSFAGIEIARIHADRQAVTILDRLARKATVLYWNDINRQYGLTYEMLPFILGDIPESRALLKKRIECGGDVDFNVDWASLIITPDCSVFKASSIIVKENLYGREVRIGATGFRNSPGGLFYPTIIDVVEEAGLFSLRIVLDDVETGWSGRLEFEIPSGYKIER